MHFPFCPPFIHPFPALFLRARTLRFSFKRKEVGVRVESKQKGKKTKKSKKKIKCVTPLPPLLTHGSRWDNGSEGLDSTTQEKREGRKERQGCGVDRVPLLSPCLLHKLCGVPVLCPGSTN